MPIRYTLSVTSPPTTGARVSAAQKILNGRNVFKRDFLTDSTVDQVFGEATGRACKRAKFWIGYPTDELTATYGPDLHAFLTGEQKPTDEMRKRTSLRIKESKKPLRIEALFQARKHRGVKEHPAGSNKVLFSDWYGIRGPWCAMFVTWCYVTAGSKAFVKGSRYAYVPYIVADARAGRNGLSVTKNPMPGDLVCYDWDGGVADHVGLFVNWDSKPGFVAIEGNTAVGNDSNGGEVMIRNRNLSQVECFVRVGR